MPAYFHGAPVGSYYHQRDARLSGFVPHRPGAAKSVYAMMQHIVHGTIMSPYVSLTSSFGVAMHYALTSGARRATRSEPAYVYQIQMPDPPSGPELIDPVDAVTHHLFSDRSRFDYRHDGPPEFLHGVISPVLFPHHLSDPYPQPPPSGGTPRPPKLSIELETLIRSLRDAEVLSEYPISAYWVVSRYEVSEEEDGEEGEDQ